MKSNKLIIGLILLTFCINLQAHDSKGQTQYRNTQYTIGIGDGGGGEVGRTPINKVTLKINNLWKKFQSEDLRINPINSLRDDKIWSSVLSPSFDNENIFNIIISFLFQDTQKIMILRQDFLKLHQQGQSIQAYKLFENIFKNEVPKNLSKNLNNKKLFINKTSPCYDSKGSEVDAFVNRLDLSGEICISSYRLSRLPEYVLDESLMVLIFHELSHLLGFDEQSALQWERFIERNLPRFIKKDITALTMGVYGKFINDSRLIKNSLIDIKEQKYSTAMENISELKGVIGTVKALIKYSKHASTSDITMKKINKAINAFNSLENKLAEYSQLIVKKNRLHALGVKCLEILPKYELALDYTFDIFTGYEGNLLTRSGLLSEPHFAICLPEGEYWETK